MAVTPYPSRYTSQPLDLTLSALADLVTAPNTAPYFTDLDQAALMTVSPLARSLLDDTTTAEMRATLEIPDISPPPTGTANTVAIFDGTGSLTADTELIYDATTNRLGIGLTPLWTLDLASSQTVGSSSDLLHTARVVQNMTLTANSQVKSYALEVESTYNGVTYSSSGAAVAAINTLSTYTATNSISNVYGVRVTITNAGTGALSSASAFIAPAPTNTGGGAIGAWNGFRAQDSTVASFTYGFYGQVNAGTEKYNLYMSGTAQNFLNGGVTLGNSTIAVDGTLRFNGTDFQGYKAGAWAPIGGGGDVTPGSVFLHMGA